MFYDHYQPISSKDNKQIKEVQKLFEKRNRDKTKTFLIEGYRELFRAHAAGVVIEKLFLCPEFFLGTNENNLIESIKAQGTFILPCTKNVFSAISYRDRPDGLLAVAQEMHSTLKELEDKIAHKKAPLLVVAESIEKPGNLGTILRSSDAAGVDAVIIIDRCTDIYNPNVVRASTGMLFALPVIETSLEELLPWLQKQHIALIAATPEASLCYTECDCTNGVAIAVGTEQLGLTDALKSSSQYHVRIPMLGKADSLNVAVATTLLLYEAVRQRTKQCQ